MNCSLKDDTHPWREVLRKVLFVVGLSNQGLDDSSSTQGLLDICVSAPVMSDPQKTDDHPLRLRTLHDPIGVGITNVQTLLNMIRDG
jgi:hypothetical protein